MKRHPVIEDFCKKCKAIYNYYRVKILKEINLPWRQEGISPKALLTFFKYTEASQRMMDRIAFDLTIKHPEISDSINNVVEHFIRRFASLAVNMRKRIDRTQ